MAYFRATKVDGTIMDFDKKCDSIDLSPAETFTYFYQSAELENGDPARKILAIINSEDIEQIVSFEGEVPVIKDEEAEKPKKTAKKK